MYKAPRMPLIVFLAALILALAGCGSSTSKASEPETTQSGEANGDSSEPEYRLLGRKALEYALVGVQDLPPGYSQDPPRKKSVDRTFCNYKPRSQPRAKAVREFTKGGGLSSEFLSVTLREFGSPKEAGAAFDALTNTLETCHGENVDGSQLKYSVMSAPKIGDRSVGVRITADEAELMQYFVLIGPTLVSTGGGGLMNANANEVMVVLKAQVRAYRDAAQP